MPLNDPVPSTAADVLERNAQDFDRFVVGAENTFVNRLGVEKLTVTGIIDTANAAIATIQADGQSALDALRVINAGSFEAGGTITARNEALLYEAEQTFYRWDGALPKTVAAASTPASTGGVGAGAWVNVGQAELASALADAADSANRVARMAITADSLKDLANAPRIANRQYSVKGFYAGSDVGGGLFYWDATRDKADHNGGTVVDPDRVDAWDGTQGDLATLFTAGVTGELGCFVRIIENNYIDAYMFGVIKDNYATDQFDALRQLIGSRNYGGESTPTKVGAIKEGMQVFIPGGIRAEVRSELRLTANGVVIKSDGDYIRLPFTQEYADVDPNGAFLLYASDLEFHNLKLDGFRATNGVGTSPNVASHGQGGLLIFGSVCRNVQFFNCNIDGAVKCNMLSFGAENIKFYGGGSDSAGEHTLYMSGGGHNFYFENFTFGSASRNNGPTNRDGYSIKTRSSRKTCSGIKIKNCKLIGEEHALAPDLTKYQHPFVVLAEGTENFEIDGLDIINSEYIVSVVHLSAASGEIKNVQFDNIKADERIYFFSTVSSSGATPEDPVLCSNFTMKNISAEMVTIQYAGIFQKISNVYCKVFNLYSHYRSERRNLNRRVFNVGNKTLIENVVELGDESVETSNTFGMNLKVDLDLIHFKNCKFVNYGSIGGAAKLIGNQDFLPLSKNPRIVFEDCDLFADNEYDIRLYGYEDTDTQSPTFGEKSIYTLELINVTSERRIQVQNTGFCHLYAKKLSVNNAAYFRKIVNDNFLPSLVMEDCDENTTLKGIATIPSGSNSVNIAFPEPNKRAIEITQESDFVSLIPISDLGGLSYSAGKNGHTGYRISLSDNAVSEVKFSYKIQPTRYNIQGS